MLGADGDLEYGSTNCTPGIQRRGSPHSAALPWNAACTHIIRVHEHVNVLMSSDCCYYLAQYYLVQYYLVLYLVAVRRACNERTFVAWSSQY
jgi:hypothetical protein